MLTFLIYNMLMNIGEIVRSIHLFLFDELTVVKGWQLFL